MTLVEKKERRELRHKLQALVLRHHFSVAYRLRATEAQLKSSARKVTDQLLAGKNPNYIEAIQ